MAETSLVHMIGRPGRKLKFKNGDELWEKFVQYCDYIDSNPWQVKTASNAMDANGDDKKNSLRQNVSVKQRAYTLYGFCAFAGIHYKWADFKKNYKERNGFGEVINAIENIVCAQQLDGAIVHEFDSYLVARLNGISDKQEIEVNGDFKWPKLTDSDIEYLRKTNGL